MLVDGFGRTIDYMRISVTERCNFRCAYCMPNTPMNLGDENEDVPLESVLNFIKVAIIQGVKKNPNHRRRTAFAFQNRSIYCTNLRLCATN